MPQCVCARILPVHMPSPESSRTGTLTSLAAPAVLLVLITRQCSFHAAVYQFTWLQSGLTACSAYCLYSKLVILLQGHHVACASLGLCDIGHQIADLNSALQH